MMRSVPWMLCAVALQAFAGSQPPEIRALAKRVVPKVRIATDAEFFAAWDLDRPGLEAVKAAVANGDYSQAKAALKGYFLNRRKPLWRTNHWQMPTNATGRPEQHTLYKQAEDALAHRFYDWQFGEKIDWNCYPMRTPAGAIDHEFSPSPVNFYHSRTLGKLYWFSLDERYAKEFCDEILDFIPNWPPPENYTNDAPCPWRKLRSAGPICGTWFTAYNYFLPSKHFTPEVNALMLRGFIERARYALRNPDSVNRYMAQLRGIYTVGAYFPELKQAKDFRDIAANALAMTIDEEFYPDGASKECCPGYQMMNLGAICGVVDMAKMMEYEVPPDLRRGLESTCEYFVKMATPFRSLPQFGDTGHPKKSMARSFSWIVNFADKPEYRWLATDGREGSPPSYLSTRLPWAGFYVMRSGWDPNALYVCMDAGPLGLQHWDEDCNDFELYAYGERLIADMGKYSYTDTVWRAWFMSSLAHNTVLVDGLSQDRAADYYGTGKTSIELPRTNDWHSDDVFDFAWGYYKDRWVDYEHYRSRPDRFGRTTARHLATHRRDMCFVKNSYWVISDRAAAKGEHTYSQLFHFEPDRTVKPLGERMAGTADAKRANIVLVQADPLKPAILRGRMQPRQGWLTQGGFHREPAPVLSYEQKRNGSAYYDTVLLPLDVGQRADVRVERLAVRDHAGRHVPAEHVCALRIVTPSGTDYYVNDLRQRDIGPANGTLKVAGPVQTDARVAVIRVDAAGKVTKASAAGATLVTLHEQTVWRKQ